MLHLHASNFPSKPTMQTLQDRVNQLEALCASLSLTIAALSRITNNLAITSMQTSESLSMVIANCSREKCSDYDEVA